MDDEPIYRADLAYIHDQGYGFHAEICAPGILAVLAPLLTRGGAVHDEPVHDEPIHDKPVHDKPVHDKPVHGGLVLEIGCGSGALTRKLVERGHRVIATDASPAMLDLARAAVPDAEAIRPLVLPDDPIPAVDAIVGIGHPLNYLPSLDAIHRALGALADALPVGGLLALDLCDLEWGALRQGAAPHARVGDDWAIVTRFSQPTPDRFDREITTFVRTDHGDYRRADEYHRTVLIDTATVPGLLARHGVQATIGVSFADPEHPLPRGLRTVIGRKTTATATATATATSAPEATRAPEATGATPRAAGPTLSTS
jgi:SAM-dependent methyltransferase